MQETNNNSNTGFNQQQEEKKLTLQEATLVMRNFAESREWGKYHTPRNLTLALMGEVGEIAEIFQWKGEVANGLPDFSEAEKVHVGEQISDVLSYLLRLADVCGIDITEAFLKKIEKNKSKYPTEKVKGNRDLIDLYKKKKWESKTAANPSEQPTDS